MNSSTKKIVLVTLLSVAAAVLLAGAGWFIYFQNQFTFYQDVQHSFSIKCPKAWKIVTAPHAQVAVVFISPKETALDTFQENFNVTIQPVPATLATLPLFSAKVKEQMLAVFNNLKVTEDKPVQWSWRQGHEIVFEAPSPDNLKMISAWTIQGDQAYILTFVGKIDQWPHYAPLVDEIFRSFNLK